MEIKNIDLKNKKLNLSSELKQILDYARKNYIPVALDETMIFLIEILKDQNPKRILEIGTAIGYSGIIMLENLPDAELVTIEFDKERYCLAKQNFEKFGHSKRVIQILGDAKDELKTLCDKNEKFDFIFLDGPKGQYICYLPLLKKLMNDDAILFADDVLLMGLVQGDGFVKHKHRTMIVKLRNYLEEINKDGLVSQIYDIGEGVAITRVVQGEKNE